jgi:hypothetical protein
MGRSIRIYGASITSGGTASTAKQGNHNRSLANTAAHAKAKAKSRKGKKGHEKYGTFDAALKAAGLK